MYEITDLKPGRAINLNGTPYYIVSSKFGRKSQSKANMQCKLRNLVTGAVISENFQGSEKIEPAELGYRRVQYLYGNDSSHTFMDLNDYDQFALPADVIGDAAQYFVEGCEVDVLSFNGKPIGVQLKSTVDMKIIETMPGVKGDTATGGTKPAKLESGIIINVPLFLHEGDKVRVNTETGMYMSRVE
ncbi:elongation factor P [Candidatus Peribacteria bacterium RIFCSPHIGHO2_02_FULL_49_16]|nr:MAG: elongation factor P [Candidatus Peribacteria bacterium RIFCSPHIGHO2_01_FULL_49_38]OGJ58797.1 MAG: elongation factor P [Candidatus Peribacteria bacterium RIFCSPHIGHO2_02_FULL_49_16]